MATPASLHAQKTAVGLAEDWSHHHILFSNPGTEDEAWHRGTHEQWLRIVNNPRFEFQQWKQRQKPRDRNEVLEKDWSMGQSSSSALLANQFPAKFTFNTTSSGSCSDFVVFPAGVTPSPIIASIVSFNNIYGHTTCSGAASNGAPTFAWAYNTGGISVLSPVLSNDATGSQVAFIQTTSSVASLVVLKWAAGPAANHAVNIGFLSNGTFDIFSGSVSAADVGARITGTGVPANDTIATVTSSTTGTLTTNGTPGSSTPATIFAESSTTPALPTLVTAANYHSCTAPCYTAVTLSGSPNDTNSAPFYVYDGSDVLYVGDNSGKLHKFVNVFNGTPAEATGSWPILVSSKILTSPIFDEGASGNIFVADSGGFLYSYKASTAAHEMTSSQLTVAGGTVGIVDAPIVDSTTEEVYVAVGDDANTSMAAGGCQNATGCSGVFQFAAGNATTGAGACVGTGTTTWSGSNCGEESIFGVGTSGTPTIYSGAFDHAYLVGSGSSGNLWTCSANASSEPRLSFTPILSTGLATTGNVISIAGTAVSTLASASASCSPVTEIWGSAGGTNDFLFVSVSASGNQTGCTGACLYNYIVATGGTATTAGTAVTTPLTATAGILTAGGTTGIIIDNTSATTGESEIYYTTRGQQSCANSGTSVMANCSVQTLQTTP